MRGFQPRTRPLCVAATPHHTYCVTLLKAGGQHKLSKVSQIVEVAPSQCRAARALLNWSQEQLEAAAKVARKTIADFEREARQPHRRTIDALRAALEAAGVEFIEENGGGPGVRLQRSGIGQAPDRKEE